jgi:hypothetical protein
LFLKSKKEENIMRNKWFRVASLVVGVVVAYLLIGFIFAFAYAFITGGASASELIALAMVWPLFFVITYGCVRILLTKKDWSGSPINPQDITWYYLVLGGLVAYLSLPVVLNGVSRLSQTYGWYSTAEWMHFGRYLTLLMIPAFLAFLFVVQHVSIVRQRR